MKRIIVTILLSSCSVIILLYVVSGKNERYKHNQFQRKWIECKVSYDTKINLDNNDYYIVGEISDNILLASHRTPFTLFFVSKDLKNFKSEQIFIPYRFSYRSITTMLDSPFYYLADGTSPFIFKGTIGDSFAQNILEDTIFFNDATPIAFDQFGFRTMINKEFTLIKKRIYERGAEVFANLLERQTDGILDQSGTLHFDPNTQHLVYLYGYRNRFIILDTNFILLDRCETIDPIDTVRIKTSNVSANTYTLSSPPLAVNLKSKTCKGFLYVNSNILAKNESIEGFELNSVIDVYDIAKKGKYVLSFYIPDNNGDKMNDFMISKDGTLYTLYNKQLVKYQICLNELD